VRVLESEQLGVAYAVLRASKDTCVSRASNRPLESLAETKVIERLWQEFEELRQLFLRLELIVP
jgi:hypothetical protein